MTTERRSCADRLRRMREDFGYTEEELEEAAEEAVLPRVERHLPTFRETSSGNKLKRIDKGKEKVKNKSKKSKQPKDGGTERYRLARWYLETCLSPADAHDIYGGYEDFEEMVDYAYGCAVGTMELMSYVVEEDIDPMRAFPDHPPGKTEIPDDQWKDFLAYCKRHPLDGDGIVGMARRRMKFKRWIRKKRKRIFRKRKLDAMYDPLFRGDVRDAKRMVKDMKDIRRENEKRLDKFREMVTQLVGDNPAGRELLQRFDTQTSAIMKRHGERIDEFVKRRGLDNPISIRFS